MFATAAAAAAATAAAAAASWWPPGALRQEVADEVMGAARQLQQQHSEVAGMTVPAAVVPCSAVSGEPGRSRLAAAEGPQTGQMPVCVCGVLCDC